VSRTERERDRERQTDERSSVEERGEEGDEDREVERGGSAVAGRNFNSTHGEFEISQRGEEEEEEEEAGATG